MHNYSFTLRLSGVTYEGFEAFADALFDPDVDCHVSICEGVVSVLFGWDAPSLREAIRLAVEHVHEADSTVRVISVEAEEGQTLDEAFAA